MWVARSEHDGGELRRLTLNSLRSLPDASLDEGEPVGRPLFLVRAHGRRDSVLRTQRRAGLRGARGACRARPALAVVPPGRPPLRGKRARPAGGPFARPGRPRHRRVGGRGRAGRAHPARPFSRPHRRPARGTGGRSRREGAAGSRRAARRLRARPRARPRAAPGPAGVLEVSVDTAEGPHRPEMRRCPVPATSYRARCRSRARRSADELVCVVGDPDDLLGQAGGRIADRDERPEDHAHPTSGCQRPRGGDDAAQVAPGSSTSGSSGSNLAAGRTAGSSPAIQLLELTEVARLEEHQPETAIDRRPGVADGVASGRAIIEMWARQPSGSTSNRSTPKMSRAPGFPERLHPVQLAAWGGAARAGVTGRRSEAQPPARTAIAKSARSLGIRQMLAHGRW